MAKKVVEKKTPSIAEKVQSIIDTVTASLIDAQKFDNGTKAAGKRVRKAMQEIKVAAQEIRGLVSEIKAAV